MQPTSTAAGVAWDLGDLYKAIDDQRIDEDLRSARARAEAFEKTYRGSIATLTADKADLLHGALVEYESLSEQLDRPAIYAMLVHSAKTDDPRHGALVARTREERTQINKHLIFFDLEWLLVPDDAAQALIAHPRLSHYRHWLEQKRAWKPHYLSEPEEKILEEKQMTGRAAFVRLFEESTAAMRFPLVQPDGTTRELTQQEILALLYDADRDVRRRAAEGITKGLQGSAHLLTYILNTVVLDHHSDTQLRKFPHAMASRNLANEIDDKVVTALLDAVEGNYTVVHRYYRLKARLLKLDRLYDYDRYAPLFADMPACEWPTAQRIVEESYTAFSPDAGRIIDGFFIKRWIDAEPRPGKRGGAFSASTVPSVHPYILLNYTDRLRDVMTLAHELGHGLHQHLSRKQGYLQCDTPLTTAEMASVFGEMLTFRRLQEIYTEPRLRLGMLCSKIEDAFATVFRQVALTRFEQKAHEQRRTGGELSTDAVNRIWQETNQAMFGDSVTLQGGYAWWWSYIGHFIRSPFYCYAYAFGELLVLALYQKYKQDGPAFVPKYLDLLAAGGSDAPHVLLAKLGVDVTQPAFWGLGLKLLGDMVAEAETLAAL